MPPPIWKKPIDDLGAQFLVPVGEPHHVLDAGAHGVHVLHVAARCSGRRTCCRASSPPSRARTSAGSSPPRPSSRSPSGRSGRTPRATPLRRISYMNSCGNSRLPCRSCCTQCFEHRRLDAPHRLVLGDARVGDAIEVPLEQALLVGRREVAVVRHALVVIVRDEVEDVLLEVGPGAADAGHLALPDHLGQRAARARPWSSRRPASPASSRRRPRCAL